MSRIGEKIKIEIQKKGITAKQIAKKCGVSESYILDVESGKKVINEKMIKKISDIIGVNLNEPMLEDEMEYDEPVEDTVQGTKTEKASGIWQSAFSNIVKDIPVYDIDMKIIKGYRHLPVIDNKIEGHNPEKLIYILVQDDSMGGFRIKKGDLCLAYLNNEPLNNQICLIQNGERNIIRQIKRLDSNKMLLIWHDERLRTETVNIKDIKVLAHLIKAEIDLRS
ncbi:MAG: helix-turn-helix transcriptional regulator [Clostridiales bacterium]|nr:helix-turn-helix transcriptional regulator [Clostridiales bacterium]